MSRYIFRRKGFTLVELLVVIALVGILIAILIPGIGLARRSARAAGAKSTMTSIQMGLTSYATAYDDLPPSRSTSSGLFGIRNGSGGQADLSGWQGAELLTHAMLGPLPETASGGELADGRTGFGFRDFNDRPVGAYLSVPENGVIPSPLRDNAFVMTMPSGRDPQPFLYYRADPQGTIGPFANIKELADGTKEWDGPRADRVWGPTGRFRIDDNIDFTQSDPALYLQGEAETRPPIDDMLSLAMELRGADYLLVHAGPDNEYNTSDDIYKSGTKSR